MPGGMDAGCFLGSMTQGWFTHVGPGGVLLRLLPLLLLPASLQSAGQGPGRSTLPGHVPRVVSTLTPIGQLPATTNLSLALGLPLRNEAELDALLEQLQDPQSTNYHKYLTPQQFAERFGPTEAQYEAVIRFAERNGLRVVETTSNRVVLDVEGSVSKVERAFGVTIRLYQHPSEPRRVFAPDTEPSVPAGLPVADMWGLSDYYRPRPLLHPLAPPRAAPLNYNGSGPGGAYQGADYRHAYVAGAGPSLAGSGQTVAVAEFDGYYPNDITTYESNCGYTNVPLQNVLLDGVSGNPGYSGIANAVAEVSLDIELAIAMAPALSKVIVYEGSNPYNVFNKIATDNLAKQISCSWAWSTGPTHNWGHPGTKTLDSQLKQMGTQGQGFFQASGDSDAYTGSQALNSSSGPIPVDSIYVTSVGGTTLTMNGAGASWASETVWNWGGNTGSGGGVSPNYSIPSWQTGVNMSANGGSTVYRNIPDVAMTADAVYVVYNNGSAGAFGGTSCSAPLWAGFTALVNQQEAAAGKPVAGFLNPALYTIGTGANYSACFRDTATGNNIGANTPGQFYAVSGYDLCTGWGTPNGTNLINAHAPYPCILTPPASQTATNGNTVTLGVTPGGQTPYSFQWQFYGTNLPASANIVGVTSNLLTFLSVASTNAGNYSVVVTNSYGAVTSSVATLSVVSPPLFTSQPTNLSVIAGSNALFSATVSGATPLAYQWQKNSTNFANGGNVAGATSNALTLTAVVAANAGNYALVASNVYGKATSSVAVLTVLLPAAITAPPAAQTVQCGSNAAFTVTAAGTAPWSYQWSLDGAAVMAATNTSFSLTNVHLPNHSVAVVVTNLYGGATSSVALTVQDTLPPVITLNGGNPLYVELGGAFADPGATASDLCAGSVAAVASGAVNTNAVSTNTITYTAGDGNGNTSTAARTVIVRDTTPPTILWSFTNLALAAGSNCAATMPDVTGTNYVRATDASGTLIISQSPTNQAVLPLGTNLVEITVADASGNASWSTNRIAVLDQTPPRIVTQPQSQTNSVGASASFGVTATACTPLRFQWYFNTAALSLMTNSTLTLSNLTTAASGNYFVVAAASGGSTTSAVATLTVMVPLRITNVTAIAGGSVTMNLTGTPGFTYIVESTTNLPPASWLPLATNTLGTNGVWQFTDAKAAGFPRGFYRFRQAP